MSTGLLLVIVGAIVVAFVAGVVSGELNADRQTAKSVESWTLVEQLRAPEGASVTLICDNPDFEGASAAVEVCDEWTGWKYRRFEGDTVLHALRNARYTKGDY
jgi:hypothetical protein